MNDLISATPLYLTVVFGSSVAGVQAPTEYVVEVELPAGRPDGTDIHGHPLHDTAVIRSAALAGFATTAALVAGTPTNDSELADLAAQLAADWYDWQLGELHQRFAGNVPYVPEGFHEVEWTVREGECGTLVRRFPMEWPDLYQSGSAGAGTTQINDSAQVFTQNVVLGGVTTIVGAFTIVPVAVTITSNQNNYNFGSTALLDVTTTGNYAVTGLTAGSDGQTLKIVNVGSNALTLANQSGSSTATNRIVTGTGTDLVIQPKMSVTLLYEGTLARWIVTDTSPPPNTVLPQTAVNLSGNTNDLTLPVGTIVNVSSSGVYNLTGIVAPVPAQGVFYYIYNSGSNNFVLTNQDGSSSSANQFLTTTGGNVTLVPGQFALVSYSVAANLWDVTVFPTGMTLDLTQQTTTISGNTDDLAVTSSLLSLTLTNNFNLTGIVAPSSGSKVLVVVNTSNHTLTLKNLTTSSSANQFRNTTGADIALTQYQMALAVYVPALSKWLVTPQTGGTLAIGNTITGSTANYFLYVDGSNKLANVQYVPLAAGGTEADLSATGPGIVVQTSMGGDLSVLADGTDTYVLTMVSGAVAWAPAPSGTLPTAVTDKDVLMVSSGNWVESPPLLSPIATGDILKANSGYFDGISASAGTGYVLGVVGGAWGAIEDSGIIYHPAGGTWASTGPTNLQAAINRLSIAVNAAGFPA